MLVEILLLIRAIILSAILAWLGLDLDTKQIVPDMDTAASTERSDALPC